MEAAGRCRLPLPEFREMRKGTGMRRLAAIALAAVMAAAAPHALAKTSEEDILLWLDGLDIGGPLPEASAVTAARGEGGEVAPGAADDEGDISDPAAQNYLGEQYCFGKGAGKDPGKAEEWFRKAAAQGHAGAQFHLGYISLFERKDYPEAIKWLRKSSDQGYTRAMVSLP